MAHTDKDGVIKYDRSRFAHGLPLPVKEYRTLEGCRRQLYALGLIGAYPNGIGFGNLSRRRNYSAFFSSPGPQFLITGSQTGHLSALTGAHYCRVLDFDIGALRVSSAGPVEASSETLTHAAIYQAGERVKAIAHVHHHALWRKLQELGFPSTSEALPYGTAEMARAVATLARGKNEGLIVMKGHVDGVICFGASLARVARLLARQVAALSG